MYHIRLLTTCIPVVILRKHSSSHLFISFYRKHFFKIFYKLCEHIEKEMLNHTQLINRYWELNPCSFETSNVAHIWDTQPPIRSVVKIYKRLVWSYSLTRHQLSVTRNPNMSSKFILLKNREKCFFGTTCKVIMFKSLYTCGEMRRYDGKRTKG